MKRPWAKLGVNFHVCSESWRNPKLVSIEAKGEGEAPSEAMNESESSYMF